MASSLLSSILFLLVLLCAPVAVAALASRKCFEGNRQFRLGRVWTPRRANASQAARARSIWSFGRVCADGRGRQHLIDETLSREAGISKAPRGDVERRRLTGPRTTEVDVRFAKKMEGGDWRLLTSVNNHPHIAEAADD